MKPLVILLTILIALTTLASAELDMTVTAEVNDYAADARLKTNPNAEEGLDGYDMIAPSSPSNFAKLYSTVESTELSIDTWGSGARTLNLVYEVNPNQEGDLNFEWTSVTDGYNANFIYYGVDENYESAVDTVVMDDESSYTAPITGASTKRYIQIAVETESVPPPPPPPPPAGGGAAGAGGGAAGEAAITGFTISRDLIKVIIKQGENIRESIRVKNTGDTNINIKVRAENIGDLVAIDQKSFTLKPAGEESIKLDIFATEEQDVDAYIGRIIISGAGIRKIVNVIIEVREKKPLFDILVNIKKKKLRPGDDVKVDIEVTNMGDLEYIDVLLYYAIKDFQGNTITFKEESLAIKQKLKVPRELEIPEDLPEGDYVFYTKVSFEDIVATGVDTFKVTTEQPFTLRILSNAGSAMANTFSDIVSNKPLLYASLGGLGLVIISILFIFISKKYEIRIRFQEPILREIKKPRKKWKK